MSATVEERARRRQLDNERRGISSTIESLVEDIARRDKYDSEREASPLVQAVDAIYLDTPFYLIFLGFWAKRTYLCNP